MKTRNFDVVLRLRRDNDYNYRKVEDKFIPERGEVCLVDTARDGLRAKIGDGTTSFGSLSFADEDIALNVIVKGYFSNNQFYSDADLTTLVEPSVNKIYVDIANNALYTYDGISYVLITQTVAVATASTAGVMKLYNTLGDNIDGTITQKAITDELNEKFEVEVDHADEEIIFSRNLLF